MSRVCVIVAVMGLLIASVSLNAQWPKVIDRTVPRDEHGAVPKDAPPPRTADGKPDLSGMWMRADSGPPRPERRNAPGTRVLEPPTAPFPFDPTGPPVATFAEAGANMQGGLPFTPWAAALKAQRMKLDSRDNPDAMCLPMGLLQFHLQPQPRVIMQTSNVILIEYEANYGLRHIYMDGRPLPPAGEPQPWWYGYSVGRWEGDTLVVETNNNRGAEDGPYDGWLDVNGSPYSREVKFTERFRRPAFDHLQIDLTVDDPKSYTKPFTVRVDQRLFPDHELIEAVCNENQQFRQRVKID